MRLHFYKLDKRLFKTVESGRKNFEARRFDRKKNPVEGDAIIFGEWDSIKSEFTGERFLAGVGFVLDGTMETADFGFVLPKDFGIFGLRRPTPDQIKYALVHSDEVMPAGLSKKIKPRPKIEV